MHYCDEKGLLVVVRRRVASELHCLRDETKFQNMGLGPLVNAYCELSGCSNELENA